MKNTFRILVFFIATLLVNSVWAQMVEPVKWTFEAKKLSNCELELIFKATIENIWHLYGQKTYGDEGPIPTTFKFTKNANYELVGSVSESNNLIKKMEEVWGFELSYFEHNATFKQKIKINSEKAFEIKGELEFMACNGTSCTPPTTAEYSFKVAAKECAKSGVKLVPAK